MKKALLAIAVLAMTATMIGCAITDYSGIVDHKTSSEAKLWGKDVSFTGFAPDLDGTYAYTVRYDNRGGQGVVTINSYRNEVPGSFSRDGIVDRDGDDVQGNGGTLGGRFLPQFVAVDATGAGVAEFFDNITQDKSSTGPLAALAVTVNEEVDADFDLHASFGSIGELLGQIWSGAVGDSFTLEVESLVIGGETIPVDTVSIGLRANGVRPMQLSIENSPAWDSVFQALLDNTEHGQPLSIGINFAGGLSVATPTGWEVAFNHDAIRAVM